MARLQDAVIAHLDEESYTYDVESDGRIELIFTTSSGTLTTWFRVDEDDEIVVYLSRCPVFVPEERRTAAMEYLTRANYGLRIGNFELDLDDGEVRYKSSLDVEGDELTPALVKRIMRPNLITMDRYLPGLMRVIYGSADPAKEIADLEG